MADIIFCFTVLSKNFQGCIPFYYNAKFYWMNHVSKIQHIIERIMFVYLLHVWPLDLFFTELCISLLVLSIYTVKRAAVWATNLMTIVSCYWMHQIHFCAQHIVAYFQNHSWYDQDLLAAGGQRFHWKRYQPVLL